MKINCYQSEDGLRWLAHMELGRDLYMPFFGPTKAEAVAKAENWLHNEQSRWGRFGYLGARKLNRRDC